MSADERHHRIDYVEFAVPDIEAAKRFYTGVFGWETTDWGPEYSSFADGRLQGGFRLDAERAGDGCGSLVVLYSSDLEATEAAVRGAGGTVVQEIFSFPGGRRFQFRDPAGNELAVWSDVGVDS